MKREIWGLNGGEDDVLSPSSTQKMKVVCFSETLTYTDESTWRHNPEHYRNLTYFMWYKLNTTEGNNLYLQAMWWSACRGQQMLVHYISQSSTRQTFPALQKELWRIVGKQLITTGEVTRCYR